MQEDNLLKQPVRLLILSNFLVLVVVILPPFKYVIDNIYQSPARYALVSSIQIWIVGSTFVATIIFVRNKFFHFNASRRSSTTADGKILAVWWAVLISICLYAFALGMGG